VTRLLLLLLLAFMPAVATDAGARERRALSDAAPAVAVRFDRTDHWQCGADGACVRCANLGGRSGLTIESRELEHRGAAPQHVEVPAHGAIRICPP